MPEYKFTTKSLNFSEDRHAESYRQNSGFESVERVREPELAEQVFVCTRKFVPEVLFKVTDSTVKSVLRSGTTGQWAVEELPRKEPAREVPTKEEWEAWLKHLGSTPSYADMIATRLVEAGATIPALRGQ